MLPILDRPGGQTEKVAVDADDSLVVDPPALHIAGYDVIETEGTWRPDLLEEKPRIGLAIALRDDNGQIVKQSAEIAVWTESPENNAERDRLAALLRAMCRYRNTGGSEFDGFAAPYPIHNVLRGFHQLPSIRLAPGWHLLDTDDSEHVFEKDDRSAYLYVVEDEFTESMTPYQFLAWKTDAVEVEPKE